MKILDFIFGCNWKKIANSATSKAEQKMQNFEVTDQVSLDDISKSFFIETLAEELKKQNLNNEIKDTKNLADLLASKISSELLANKKSLENTDLNAEISVRDTLQHIAESICVFINTNQLTEDALLATASGSAEKPENKIVIATSQDRDLNLSVSEPFAPTEKILNTSQSIDHEETQEQLGTKNPIGITDIPNPKIEIKKDVQDKSS
jgi:hypothetical protein